MQPQPLHSSSSRTHPGGGERQGGVTSAAAGPDRRERDTAALAAAGNPPTHLHFANQPSKAAAGGGSSASAEGACASGCACSLAAGVLGREQLYSMAQLASEAGDTPGACAANTSSQNVDSRKNIYSLQRSTEKPQRPALQGPATHLRGLLTRLLLHVLERRCALAGCCNERGVHWARLGPGLKAGLRGGVAQQARAP